MKNSPRFKRVVVKISGETIGDTDEGILNSEKIRTVSEEIIDIFKAGVQVALVVGGGNIVRGHELSKKSSIQPVTADYMGMMATVINALALQDTLEKRGAQTRVMSALQVQQVAEPFIRRRSIRHLEKGRIVILAAGTGSPHFTTDTAAALKAAEINSDVLIKATTKVDGVYDSDPLTNTKAHRYKTISYLDVINKGLKIMDLTAISLCMENKIPIIVFNIMEKGSLKEIIFGKEKGTTIHSFATKLAG
ncbi:MAG: UMP kinase [Planctomycetes bacterium]|nr:UMP kinase [Planctomycetota bacterium]